MPDDTASSPLISVDLSYSEQVDPTIIIDYYSVESIIVIIQTLFRYLHHYHEQLPPLPYYTDIDLQHWLTLAKSIDIYVTDLNQGQELNQQARDKDYATNILSYPSDLPSEMITILPELPLGELVICHAVVEHEAAEHNKTISQHLTHLIIHGVLHLLGYDHELGAKEQHDMETIEITVLQIIGLPNPYES